MERKKEGDKEGGRERGRELRIWERRGRERMEGGRENKILSSYSKKRKLICP